MKVRGAAQGVNLSGGSCHLVFHAASPWALEVGLAIQGAMSVSASPFSRSARWTLIVACGAAALIWLLRPALLPFVAGGAMAYFLAPVVTSLERGRVPRWAGALLVLLGFAVVGAALVVVLVPLVIDQVGALIQALPGYLDKARSHVVPWIENLLGALSPETLQSLQGAAGSYAGTAVGWAGVVLRDVIGGGRAIVDLVALGVVTPVVAFYLLRDWPRLIATVDGLLPARQAPMLREAFRDIDRTLAGFVRGQALVCLALGTIYSVGLTLAGLTYGVAVGLVAGVLSFIPYVGSSFCLIGGLVLGYAQFDDVTLLWRIIAVFLVGQSLEGYVLTPRLVGKRVGLHPVWILFALFAGGALLGFTGVLIAVPAAAIIGVVVRQALRAYKAGPAFPHHGSEREAP